MSTPGTRPEDEAAWREVDEFTRALSGALRGTNTVGASRPTVDASADSLRFLQHVANWLRQNGYLPPPSAAVPDPAEVEAAARAIHQEQNRGAAWKLAAEYVRDEYRRLAVAALSVRPAPAAVEKAARAIAEVFDRLGLDGMAEHEDLRDAAEAILLPALSVRPAPAYPHQSGDTTAIGPECFASADQSVICWQGVNYYREPDDDELARVFTVMDGMDDGVTADAVCECEHDRGQHDEIGNCWHVDRGTGEEDCDCDQFRLPAPDREAGLRAAMRDLADELDGQADVQNVLGAGNWKITFLIDLAARIRAALGTGDGEGQ